MFSPELTKLHGKELASDFSFCALQNIKIPQEIFLKEQHKLLQQSDRKGTWKSIHGGGKVALL